MSPLNDDMKAGFHWRDGWFFKREEDGSVRISFVVGEVLYQRLVIPESEWASIVCSVSAMGENGSAWTKFRQFHMGKPVEYLSSPQDKSDWCPTCGKSFLRGSCQDKWHVGSEVKPRTGSAQRITQLVEEHMKSKGWTEEEKDARVKSFCDYVDGLAKPRTGERS